MTEREPATQIDDIPPEQLPMIIAAILSYLNVEIVRVRVGRMPYYEVRQKGTR